MARYRAWAVVFLVVAFSASVWAQAPTAPPAEPAPAPPSPGGTRREVARLYLVQRMRESLALSDAQTLKVMDLFEAIDRERIAGQAEQRQILDGLRGCLESPSTPDERFKELVAEFQKRQARTDAALKDQDLRLMALLTPRQQAQYIVLRRQLMDELREEGPKPKADRPNRRWGR